ncbi:MAG: cation transporter, partial [Methylobacterium sp.]
MGGHHHHEHAHGGHDHGHSHGHSHGHGHSHAPASFDRAFAVGIALNIAYVLAEGGAGLWTGSVALLADAGHNLS